MSSCERQHRDGIRRLLAGVAAAVALTLGTSGCLLQVLGDGSDHSKVLPEVAWAPPVGMPDEVRTDVELRQMAQAVLDRRARALREGNLSDFAVDIDRSDPDFVAAQRRLFDNLQQLPVQVLDFEVEKDTWNTNYAEDKWESTALIPFVREHLQLLGFDRYPVETVFGVTFAERGGRWRIVSDTDVSQMTADGAQETPWDLTAIKVVDGDGVLGIFDEGSIDSAETVMSAAEHSIDIVSRALPVKWDRSVVLYALSDKTALSRLGGIPGGDLDSLSGISFPVYQDIERSARMASVRVLVHPDYISAIEPRHDVLLTHEMTHVAVARKSGGAPIWMQEGLAEYVATNGADEKYWWVSRDLAERAAEGSTEMPNSYKFNTVDQDWNYSMSLMACDYIADVYGVDTLWDVFTALQRNDWAQTDEQQEEVLLKEIGIDSSELARRAARRMVETSAYVDLYDVSA